MVKGTITKTGNSYAIRVPKSYVTDSGLELGDTVMIEEPIVRQQKALAALVAYSQKAAPLAIADPVAWQREQRDWGDPWQEAADGIAR